MSSNDCLLLFIYCELKFYEKNDCELDLNFIF